VREQSLLLISFSGTNQIDCTHRNLSTLYGKITAQNGDPRIMQFALKYSF